MNEDGVLFRGGKVRRENKNVIDDEILNNCQPGSVIDVNITQTPKKVNPKRQLRTMIENFVRSRDADELATMIVIEC